MFGSKARYGEVKLDCKQLMLELALKKLIPAHALPLTTLSSRRDVEGLNPPHLPRLLDALPAPSRSAIPSRDGNF
ncbi:protein of unknown function [Hyphomicrobium sp. MC1]|nr:protein of unknown function [Hyphomicrobium sp. MC1]